MTAGAIAMVLGVLLFSGWAGAVWAGREGRWVGATGAGAVALMAAGLLLLWGSINE